MAYAMQRGIQLGFAFALAALIGNAIVAVVSTRRLVQTNEHLVHSYTILTEIETVVSSLKDADAGHIAYVLSGQETYLQSVYDAVARIDLGIRRLGELTSDSPVQQITLDALKPLVVSELTE